ncbi:MAG: tryptophan-rich sensory protein, partial [Bacteroidaceae bacterium]|nr:tryptophan-rich sensory protein [Bacteroidaceae bacterium]
PPNLVFPIVWSILYLLMGISAGLVSGSGDETRRLVLTVFVVQLVLNFLWCITFFTMRNPLLGLIDILLLDAMVLLYIVLSYRVHRTASYLFVPYIVWLMMATYLNAYIYAHN